MHNLRGRIPRAPQMNVSATWLLVLPILVLGTWVLATMTTTSMNKSFSVKKITPTWNKANGEGFVGHKAVRHLVGIHYKRNEHTSIDYCDHDTMPFPYATVNYQTSYRNYNASFRMMLHHPETDYGISGSLFNSNGAYEWKSHLKKIMTNFFDEVRQDKITDPLVLDVGSNIGATSLWLAALGYRVHAFEPAARNFALMHCSYVINPDLHDKLWLSNVGLSDQERSGVCMKYTDGNKGDAFITTGRLHWEDYYQYQEEAAAVGSLQVTPEVVEEIKEERVEAKMELEAEANQAKLDAEQAQGRRKARRLQQDPQPQPTTTTTHDAATATTTHPTTTTTDPSTTDPNIPIAQPAAGDPALTVDVPAGEGVDAPVGTPAPVGEEVVETPYEEYYQFEDDTVCDEYNVNLITLDWYWEHRLKREQVTLLKLDVEGYESKVLAGGARMFKENPPRYVLMEVHPMAMRKYRTNPEEFYHSIRALGYWLIAVDGQEIKQDTWESLISQQGRLFDTLWVRTEPPSEGKFDWGIDYFAGYNAEYSYAPAEESSMPNVGSDQVVADQLVHTAGSAEGIP